jgi:hypothetical protein
VRWKQEESEIERSNPNQWNPFFFFLPSVILPVDPSRKSPSAQPNVFPPPQKPLPAPNLFPSDADANVIDDGVGTLLNRLHPALKKGLNYRFM